MDPVGERSDTAISARGSDDVARNVIRSAFSLIGQGLAVKVVAYGCQVALTRILTPQLFGAFGISSFFLTMIRFLADFGLSGALVQKKADITDEELSTIFTVQLAIMMAGFVALFIAAPFIQQLYRLDISAMWLLRGMAFSLLLTAFRSIASVRLTRQVRLGPVNIADSVESLLYWAVAVPMAFMGFGIWSFVGGVLAGAVGATITIYAIAPYRPRLGVHWPLLRGLLRFSLPYQGLRVLNIMRDSLGPVVLSAFAGAAALGFVSWAYSVAGIATFVTNSITGYLLFPAFSRLQSDRPALGRAVERAVQVSSMTLYPAILTILAVAPLLVHVVYTSKWAPGLPALYLVGAISLMVPLSHPMYQLLLGVGRVRINTVLFVAATSLEWAIGIPMIMRFGILGLLSGVLFATYATGICWILAGSQVCQFRLLPNVAPYFLTASLGAIVVRVISHRLPQDGPSLLVLVLFSGVFYIAVLWAVWRGVLRDDVRYVLSVLRTRASDRDDRSGLDQRDATGA